MGPPIAKCFIRPFCVVKMKIQSQLLSSLLNFPVLLKIHLVVFDCPPQTDDKDIITKAPPAVHTDSDSSIFHTSHEFLTHELGAPARIKDFRPANPKNLL